MQVSIYDQADMNVLKTYIKALDGKKTIGLTSGSFDLFHYYHLVYLERCKRMCDILIVGLDSDDLIKKVKGEARPIISEARRIAIVDQMKCVDFSFIMGTTQDHGVMAEIIKPDLIFKNDAFKEILKENNIFGQQFAKDVVIIPDLTQSNSTSNIIREIIDKHTEKK